MPPKGWRKPESDLKRKGKPRIQTSQFYMGEPVLREQRLAHLDKLVSSLGVESRSQLLQMIADDKMRVEWKPEYKVEGQIKLLMEQLAEAQKRTEQLEGEITVLKAGG